jgi:hypothetical protein
MGLQTRQPQERHQFGGKAKNSQWFLEGSVNSPRSRRSIRILTFIHVLDGPERYGAFSFFETIPSSPSLQIA